MRDTIASLSLLGAGIASDDAAWIERLAPHPVGPDASLLPPILRRRTSIATRLAIAAAGRACAVAGVDPATVATIFCSEAGEIQITDRLCRAIARSEFPLSPTAFHNSVHNTALGYWSIVTGNMLPAQAMAADGEELLAMGLLEARCQLAAGETSVLLVLYDESPPPAMVPDCAMSNLAVALLVAAADHPAARAAIDLVDAGDDDFSRQTPVAQALPLAMLAL